MERNRVSFLAVRPSHRANLETLPPLHRDPFNRMLGAQANVEGMTIPGPVAGQGSFCAPGPAVVGSQASPPHPGADAGNAKLPSPSLS